MIEDIRRVLFLLSTKERKQLFGLVIIILITAMFEMFGVASIFPFLSVLSNPDLIRTNAILWWFYEYLAITSDNNYFLLLGGVSFVILLISNGFRALSSYLIIYFSLNKFFSLNKKMMTYYLSQPYSFYLDRNSTDLTNSLVIQINAAIAGVITPWLSIVTSTFLILVVTILLLVANPLITISIFIFMSAFYFLVYKKFKFKLTSAGENVRKSGKEMMKVASEGFGGIKEIKLMGKESKLIDKYCEPVRSLAKNDIYFRKVTLIPNFLSELIGFGGLLLILMFLILTENRFIEIVPILGLYALGLRRLVPALQSLFQDVTNIRFFRAALDDIYDDLIKSKNNIQNSKDFPVRPMPFSSQIELRDITFQYKGAKDQAIANLSLTIEKNTSVGIVGTTGAGKTTLIDIIMGLLKFQEGELIIDGVIINDNNLRSWQSNIGYVPQNIHLIDDTVSRNIAFWEDKKDIDQRAIEHSSSLANIHDFIVNELPQGYETKIGEQGVRLSGGQRQRLGVARALYCDPSLLVFDEATSSVDGITENTIMNAIQDLSSKKTILIIAHRLTTVKNCDIIYMLDRGEIKDKNIYSELLKNNETFKTMAKEIM